MGCFFYRTQFVTTCPYTSVSWGLKTWKVRCGQSTKWSFTSDDHKGASQGMCWLQTYSSWFLALLAYHNEHIDLGLFFTFLLLLFNFHYSLVCRVSSIYCLQWSNTGLSDRSCFIMNQASKVPPSLLFSIFSSSFLIFFNFFTLSPYLT